MRWAATQHACCNNQVWNASKLSSHEEIARGSVHLPPLERQGDTPWNQRVQVTAAPSASRKASVSRGEVGLRLQYTPHRVRPCSRLTLLDIF